MMRNAYKKFSPETPKGGDHSETLGVDGRIIIKWILSSV
jgi:hypothetical protein